MNGRSYRPLPPPSPAAGGVEGFVARVLGALVWLTLAALGAVFALSLLVWLAVALVVSLVASLFTGRPAAVTVLWRRYRDMTRQMRERWPQRTASATPRADAATATGAADAAPRVQDVAWREVPAADAEEARTPRP